jgi:protein O-GlcNAc transferase
MNSLTVQLAALRLAPLQGTTWGHPETSGLPTLDFYLSGEGLEPPDAQKNYSERLILLPNMGVYVESLNPTQETIKLRDLGLPENEPLLICAGSPFKYSPLQDQVWIEIAKGLDLHGTGRLVFFAERKGSMHLLLADRLRRSFAQVGMDFDARVCIIPFQSRSRFFGLLKQAALMLDTLDFSGFNTALQSIECGLPYLALEGAFMRGRLASCILQRIGLPELVATSYEDFARRAIALATDKKRLKKLRKEIEERRQMLFKDVSPIRALEQFLTAEIGNLRAAQPSHSVPG